jgi:hypothetical protein
MKRFILEETKNAIIESRKAGMRYNEISAKYGVSKSYVNRICLDAGIRAQTHSTRKTDGRTCPKCHRGPFPKEYTFCPYCTTDMRSERELVIESLQRAKDKLPTPFDDVASSINFAIAKAIMYLSTNK